MARKNGGLPKGTLDTLIDETKDAPAMATEAVIADADAGDHDPLPVKTRNRKAKKAIPPYTAKAGKKATPRKAPPRALAARPVVQWETDPVSRYAASRGLPVIAGPIPAIRLAAQFAMDLREVARKERTNVLAVVSKALAGYLNSAL